MFDLLRALRKKVVIGFIGGSDLKKISEQLSLDGNNGEHSGHIVLPFFDLTSTS
jgi:hypothetical protein